MDARMSHPPAHRKERDERGTTQYLVIRFLAAFDRATCLSASAGFGLVSGGVGISLGTDAVGNAIWQLNVSWTPKWTGAGMYGYSLNTYTKAASTGVPCQ